MKNILIEIIFPAAGIIGFFYCLFFLYNQKKQLRELNITLKSATNLEENIKEEINTKLGSFKISTFALTLLTISAVFILPVLIFYYKGYSDIELRNQQIKTLFDETKAKLDGNTELIQAIKNCCVPISFELEVNEPDRPSLDDIQCTVFYNDIEMIGYPSYGPYGYKMQVSNIDCEKKIKRIIVQTKDESKKWQLDSAVEACMFVNRALLLKKAS
jgi:hypothetical protein